MLPPAETLAAWYSLWTIKGKALYDGDTLIAANVDGRYHEVLEALPQLLRRLVEAERKARRVVALDDENNALSSEIAHLRERLAVKEAEAGTLEATLMANLGR